MKAYAWWVAAALAGAGMAASAQTLKPGLWEVSNRMQSGSGQMEAAMAQAQAQMAQMPPDQRKMMEEMMAKHGTRMGAGPAGGVTIKVCLTKEMVERNELPTREGDCKTTQQPRTGNSMKFGFTCANPVSSGEGEVTFSSPDAYAMKMKVSTSMQGRPETLTMDANGKWMGADCGNVKPISQAARK